MAWAMQQKQVDVERKFKKVSIKPGMGSDGKTNKR